ncbi:MAG TPA: Coenzyme F420 hydrogenase/dehydrogenase, beta subunit C-terminal domain [Candidatus Methanoculleus thermohydrogenotrophicum]|jgi:coenzyme F420 hydrogenase subunit beta|nr:Coenzyme F420 hydrogenase/dehydrogenase, beta subunit C-terminal domain [Candidatus Methanoculleus thermohydrogenotrophicum]NLM82048.1 4Fe-4S binding protein [Candidatus Methanoculleus thermohydrogenotrophicum]HOB17262.1 Coenzyme F420 hydrogenase/dehydrogenase, beta subunit C-terminal domain [Candidatus Methanoculleus thermohydrogenotrophicum]HPZ37453.1 Coenzyme F420 hydrogenase/dehydrogenase, beta subunit C-terminal domain [Candidatus Methanoculleus thermohydrogenotrophicum]HQC90870.1 Coenz
MSTKSFKDLEAEVWVMGLCSGCGACVAVCPADALRFAPGNTDAPVNIGYCKSENDSVPCGACYTACPRVDLASQGKMLGPHQDIVAARSVFPVERKQSGGAVTAILVNALDEGLIDAVVTVTRDPWTMKPSSAVITTSDALIQHAGSRYSWWVPLLASLKEAVITRKYRRVAVVGVPCVARATKAIRESDHELLRPYAKAIRIVIGLFCTETFDYARLVEGKLQSERGIDPWDIRHLDIKGKLDVYLQDERRISIPLADLQESVRPGCRVCTDFTAVEADVSAGAVGSPDGYTTLVIRNDIGRGFVDRAIWQGKLATGGSVDIASIERLAAKKAEQLTE